MFIQQCTWKTGQSRVMFADNFRPTECSCRIRYLVGA